MKRLIVPLNSRRNSDVNTLLVGSKGANLLKLNQQGFKTAPGFIITTNVFQQFIHQSGKNLFADFNASDAESYTSHKKIFSSLQFNPKVTKKIEKHHQKLSGTVAVRSSMVGEDQASASFAGQLDTYLNVGPAELMASIKMCYAALFKPELQHYISGRKMDFTSQETDLFAMAVIVQQMVPAKYSGIVFTADPISGRREVIIEASTGIGENIVSGTVNPDRYIVNASGQIAQMMPVKKEQPLLSPEQIMLLAESANRITRLMGFPQDIEWAWDGKSFIFLQSRPISTLAGKNIYSSKLMADMSPGLLKPLQWSTYTQAMTNHVFARLFTEIIGSNDFDFTQSIRLIHSRLYANVTFFEDLFQRLGLPVNFFEMITRDETGRRHRPKLTLRFLSILFFRFVPFIWKYSRISRQMNDFIIKQDALLTGYRKADWVQSSITEKHKQLKNLMKIHIDAQWSIIITWLNMSIRNVIMKKLVRRHAPTVEPSDLIKGLANLKGMEPSLELKKLSRHLQSFPDETIRLCIEGDKHKIRKALKSSEAGKQLLNEFDVFTKKFGHLSANTTNFTETPWIENTRMIWSLIGKGALQECKTDETNNENFRGEKKQEVLKELFLLQKPVFIHLLNSTITYLNLREKISLLLSEDTYQFRRLVLSLGADLVKKRIINQADDIFFLYLDELEFILDADSAFTGIKDKVRKRRNQLKADEQIIPDDTVCGDQVIIKRPEKVNHAEFLTGICGSSGFKHGYAYVVRSQNKVKKTLTCDDILVVPFTHVGWTPLFSSIGGIIAETGGQLSHTSIVAREYGIPAVVNVPQATQSIVSGQPLTIDADNGKIYLKHLDPLKGE